MGFSGNSLLVEASVIGLLFRIAPAKYKVGDEEIYLHWDSFELLASWIMFKSILIYVLCILLGLPKCTTRKNTERYYTPNLLKKVSSYSLF